MATALVVGNMIGSGVFLLPASLGAFGPISLVAFGATALGAVLLALVFARLGQAFPATGGPYAYSRRAFGDFVGFQTAWGYWIAAWVGNAAIATAFVAYLSDFLDDNWNVRLLAENDLAAALTGIAAIWVLTWLNVLGVRRGGWMQLGTTVLKFVPLVAVAVLGVFWVSLNDLGPFNVSGDSSYGAITAAATLTLWAFIGLESATVPADDVRDPRRTIPWATIVGTVVTAGVYVLATFVIFGVLGTEATAASTAPFADAAREMWGGWGGDVIGLAAIVSTFGCLNGWILLQGQIPMAAARDGLFPKPFTKQSRHGAPWFGLVASSVLITGLVMMSYEDQTFVTWFEELILLATLTTLIPYAFSAAAELSLFVTDRAAFSAARLTKDTIVGLLAFAYAVWTIAGSGYAVVYKGFLLLMFGIPVYLYMKWQGSRERAAPMTVVPASPATVEHTARIAS
ncbi:MAG TPA: amino acid permease [Acidimicrobiia bacterium]|nr:amino acid permease [Acidimicrobiia bacterium]